MSGNPGNDRPHLLVLFADQLRADSVGCAGHPVIRTPNIDRLAEEGVRFTHAFTTSPICCPARHSLATGLYPHNSNAWMDPDCMAPGTDTYMRRLQDIGYRTCLVGKAHFYDQENVDLKPYEAFMRSLGFEDLFETGGSWSNVGAQTIYDDYLKQVGGGLDDKLYSYYRRLDALPDVDRRFIAEASPLPAEHVLDSFIGKTAVEYIDGYDDDRPSFLFVGFQGPHEPWDAPEPYASMYDPDDFTDPIPETEPGDWVPRAAREYARYAQYFQPERPHAIKEVRANYCGKVTLIDDWVGRILDAYRRKGWLENTVVIFASDHGDMLGDLNRISKSMFFESSVRVPMIVRLPNAERRSAVSDALVELIDLYPTILEAADCPIPKFRDGQSLIPLVRGEVGEIRSDVLGEVHVHTMLRDRSYKYVVGEDGKGLQLFDLESDSLEQKNLVGHPDYEQIERRMRDRLLVRLLESQHHSTERDPSFSAHVSVQPD
jgi:choline-sulfatase